MRTDGRGGAKQFGIVAQFKGTPRGREFAEKSLPPAAALGPGEIVVGVDRMRGGAVARLVEKVCKRHGVGSAPTMARAERLDARRFHLANVVWHCYKASCDVAGLAFDIDAVLRATAVRSPELVDRSENAAVCTTRPILTRGASERIRLAPLRIRAMTDGNAFAGLCRAHLSYCANVREEGIASIANGLDGHTVMAIRANGTHKVATLPDIGEDSLDLQNSDYPWRQFGDGIRHDANDHRGGRVCGGRCAPPLSLQKRCLQGHLARAYDGQCAPPLSRPPRRLHASCRAVRGGGDGPCRTPTRRRARWRGSALLLSGSQSTSRCTSGTLATGIAGRLGLTEKNDSAASAVSLVRGVARGRHRRLASMHRKGIKGRRRPHCAVNVAVGRAR